MSCPEIHPQPTASSIPQRFSQIADEHPGALAVTSSGRNLTYAELDTEAEALAGRLFRTGVRRGDAVAIRLERSADLIVALLATLRAGASYLVLDNQDPADRSTGMLADSAARLLVTQPGQTGAANGGLPVLLVPAADSPSREPGPPSPAGPAGPADIAYIAYTSGSTGRPKGVCVPHRAVLRLVVRAGYLPVGPDDVFLHFASAAFDAATLEIWGALLNGARLVVAPPDQTEVEALAELVAAERVTVLWLTSGLFNRFADLLTTRPDLRFPALRWLFAGGDVLSPAHVDRAATALPNGFVVNGYGPTENTTFTCCHVVREPLAGRAVPIGRPVSGTSTYLLDDDMRAVPDGQVGRLYAAGSGLAHCYLNHPALTAACFLPDPFATEPGARMYDTGDLARRDPDGVVSFIGRTDSQIKIRGFRVEPGEIEVALRADPDVSDAVVTAAGGEPDRVLVAYYMSGFPVSASALRRNLRLRLPDYMIPARFVWLEKLPLTQNGKVDRDALVVPARFERPDIETEYRAPAGPIETWLTGLWEDLIGLEPVGADDHFFDLGGHSLAASNITGEIATEYGVRVTARQFYLNPTVAELASVVSGLIAERDAPDSTPVRRR